MTITQIRAVLKQYGYNTTADLDCFDVKRAAGVVIGVMLTGGTVAYLTVETR